jgi:hypothetical protein
MSNDEQTLLSKPIEVMTDALNVIAGNDCWGPTGDEYDANEGCDCVPCIARRALMDARDWRFYTNTKQHQRLIHNPRERKIHAAWKQYLESAGGGSADYRLAQILWEDRSTPSVRDWYVATCVVQWLTTNVGMSILEAAGYKYQEYDQDRGEDDARDDVKAGEVGILRLRRQPAKPDPKTDPKAPLHRPPIFGVVNRRGQVVTTGNLQQLKAFAAGMAKAIAELERSGSDPGEF